MAGIRPIDQQDLTAVKSTRVINM